MAEGDGTESVPPPIQSAARVTTAPVYRQGTESEPGMAIQSARTAVDETYETAPASRLRAAGSPCGRSSSPNTRSARGGLDIGGAREGQHTICGDARDARMRSRRTRCRRLNIAAQASAWSASATVL